MISSDLKPRIESALAQAVGLREESDGSIQVLVPFYFQDGDGFSVYLRAFGDRWELTDFADTFQHLSYHTDVKRLREGTRGSFLERVRSRHAVEDRDGELVTVATAESIGEDVFRFVQALVEVSDLTNLDREIVRSSFRDDLRALVLEAFPQARQDYVDEGHDADGRYAIPYVLNSVDRPIAVFDVNSDERALEALFIVQKFRSWGRRLHFVAVEENQEDLTRRHVAWLSKEVDKQFPALAGAEEDLIVYLREQYGIARSLSAHASDT